MNGEVNLLEPLGSDTYVELANGKVSITARTEPDREILLGDKVTVQLARPKLHIFDAKTGARIEP
jgi:multiple sugar transport system ATP-binding protein